MTPEEKSAIIGYWRMTQNHETIAVIMGIPPTYVKQIVEDYLKKKK